MKEIFKLTRHKTNRFNLEVNGKNFKIKEPRQAIKIMKMLLYNKPKKVMKK